MAGLTASGLGSGIDVRGLVDQLVAAERQPVASRLNLREARTNAELSALGRLKSALSQFRDTLRALTDLSSLQGRRVTVSDTEILSARAGSAAVPGSYAVEVRGLATAQKVASAPIADANLPVGTGILTLAAGDSSIQIAITEPANTLRDIRDAINGAPGNPGVRATIVTADDGARLILSGTTTGAANAFSLSVSDGDGGLAPFAFTPGAPASPMSLVTAAADAVLRVDGYDVTSSSNTVTGAVEGLTLDLARAEPDTEVNVTVNYDLGNARNLVQGFVDAYNRLVSTIAEVTRYNPETREAAPLLGDPVVRGIRDGLRRELTGLPVPGGGPSLAGIGITTEQDGKLKLDPARLDAAFAADFDLVGRLFAGQEGLAGRLEGIAAGVLASSGSLAIREGNLRSNLKAIGSQREALDRRLEQVRSRLENQFNAMDRLLSQLRSTSDFLARQLVPRNNQ